MATTTVFPGGRLVFKDQEFIQAVRDVYQQRLEWCAEIIKQAAKEELSDPAPPSSQPGQPPHANTSKLRDSVFADVDMKAMEIRVGTPLMYGLFLEQGVLGGQLIIAASGKMLSWIDQSTGERRFARQVRMGQIKARPWLRRAFQQSETAVRGILETPFEIHV